jgi:hypothetical protein
MRILFFTILLGWIFSSSAYAQKQLVLVKKNKVIARISEGESIRFKRKGEDHFARGIIEGIQKESFRIGEDTTYLYNVVAIDLRGKSSSGFKVRQSGVMLIVAGSALLVISAINTGVPGSGITTVSGAFIGTGIFMLFVNNDIFKIGRKKKVIAMDHK